MSTQSQDAAPQDTMANLGLDTAECVDVDIPPCLDVTATPNGGQWTVKLYGEGCLDCSTLVQDAEEDYSNAKCHFNQGNTFCPARHMQIAFIGPKVLAIKRIKAAQDSGDSQAIIRQMLKLSELSETDRRAVLAECGLTVRDPVAEEKHPVAVDTEVESGPPDDTEGAESSVVEEETTEVTEVDC